MVFESRLKENVEKYNKEYYLKRKADLLLKGKELKHCDVCNRDVSSSNFSKHAHSEIHRLNDQIRILSQAII